nr:ABC transporter permease [Clostridia bacterium]
MDVLIGILTNIFEEGFIYGIMAMGVYISYKVMDFPDLSVDGTFPLGMCVTASMITAGADPLLACIVAFIAGIGVGALFGLIN